jgi:hypothetical protein
MATADPPKMTARNRHIASTYHWFREHLEPGVIEVKPISTIDQKGDILTKATTAEIFVRLRRLLLGW